MQAQAPLWLTIVLGFLIPIAAAGGAVGGQWLASRRDDKRWDRERDREDLRWSRDQQRQVDDRTHMNQVHWRTERLTVYGKFIVAMTEWYQGLYRIYEAMREQSPIGPGMKRKMLRGEATSNELYGLIMVIGSSEVRNRVTGAMIDFAEVHREILETDDASGASSLWSELEAVTSLLRAELGVEATIESANPGPSSATTS